MLKLLVRNQLMDVFRGFFYDAKKHQARDPGSIVILVLLFLLVMCGLLGGMFAVLSLSLCAPLAEQGLAWLYFSMLGLLAVCLGTFGSVFNSYAALYLAKDNDLLLSMPIPVKYVLGARMLSVYILSLLYSGTASIPAVIVNLIVAGVSARTVLGGLLFILVISVFVLTLSCVLGWVVAKVSLKLKNKSFVTVAASLAFFGLYYFCYFKAQSFITELLANAAVYGAQIKGAVYPAYLFGQIGVCDPLPTLISLAIAAGLFALVWTVLRRSFLDIATATGRSERKLYRETAVKQQSADAALLRKEFSRLFSSPLYLLNCGFGILFLPIGGVALLWKADLIRATLDQTFGSKPGSLAVLAAAAFCLLASMNDMATPSISLEGKSLWLLQSLPVTPRQVLRAKFLLQFRSTAIPGAVFLVLAFLALPMNAAELLLVTLASLGYTVFAALFSLFLALKTPNLTWTSEVTPIKQSLNVAVSLFSSWFYGAALAALYLAAGWRLGSAAYLGVFLLLTLAGSGALWLWIRKRGPAIFTAL
mgnify:CR=1 FL=1